MDLLWTIAHPSSSIRLAQGTPSFATSAGSPFSVPTPPLSDGSRDVFEDFVGALQFWGFALVSGSGDSVLRMWDSRYNQCSFTGVLNNSLSAHWAGS